MPAPTVLSVPEGHPYVRALQSPREFTYLADPTDPWWPHPALEPAYLLTREVDVLHLHFGFEHRTPAQLQELVEALSARRVPLVLTVHDLRNPHHLDPAAHDAALDVLVPAAAAVITLTPGAAAEIVQRWGRQVTVLAHPSLVDPDRAARRAPRDGFVVGVHLKSLRPNTDLSLLPALAAAAQALPGTTLRVDLHDEVLDPRHPRHDPQLLPLLEDLDADVRVHAPFSDEDLLTYLEGLDVSVLLYRFGTHSGWLETCYDVGTLVLAPTCGYLQEQQDCFTYATGDGGSLGRGLTRAHGECPSWKADPAQRAAQRASLSARQADLYRDVLSGAAA